ncbi:MAG TPA: hypothetical protein VLT33_17740 [Labilithrix sp.]|nr:hypothetical protein [Labilithrix sp.]
MATRTESIVLHRRLYDLTRTLPWLERYNETHEQKATLFHLLVFACARALRERTGLNRFVSGGHFYQRRAVHLSFVAKKALADDAPFVTVKLHFPDEQTFAECVAMIVEETTGVRGGKTTAVDTELRLAFAVPSFVLRMAVHVLRWLDAVNLLPASMIASDPMYTSLFLANLGSVGIDDTFHHLFEWGNCPLFGAMGQARKHVLVDESGAPAVREAMYVNWTFDERVNDGLYCMASLAIAQRIFEQPDEHVS